MQLENVSGFFLHSRRGYTREPDNSLGMHPHPRVRTKIFRVISLSIAMVLWPTSIT
jgi:hypothetical protein